MPENYQIYYQFAQDHYFPKDQLDTYTYPLFRVAHEIWLPGSSYHEFRQDGVTWLQVKRGQGKWRIGANEGRFKINQLLCYGLNTPCLISVNKPLELRLLYTFSSGDIYARQYGLLPETILDLGEVAKPCWNILEQILQCALLNFSGKQKIANSLMRAWLDWVACVSIDKDKHESALAKAKDFIDANLDKIASLQEIAEYCKCSVEHFSRLFKKQYNQSPWHYIRTRQMHLAAEILKHGSMNIENLSQRFGYKERYAFSKAFKKYYGVSPSKVSKK